MLRLTLAVHLGHGLLHLGNINAQGGSKLLVHGGLIGALALLLAGALGTQRIHGLLQLVLAHTQLLGQLGGTLIVLTTLVTVLARQLAGTCRRRGRISGVLGMGGQGTSPQDNRQGTADDRQLAGLRKRTHDLSP